MKKASKKLTDTPLLGITSFVNIHGLRTSGIFPKGREPGLRTLREWTKRRYIPAHRLGGLVYYDPEEVSRHISTKLLVPPRNK